MSDPIKNIQKSSELLKGLSTKYDESGNFSKNYYDELVKAEFADKVPKQTTLDEFEVAKPLPKKIETAAAPAVPSNPAAAVAGGFDDKRKLPDIKEAPKVMDTAIKQEQPEPKIAVPSSNEAPERKQFGEEHSRQLMEFNERKKNYPQFANTLKLTGNPIKDHWNQNVIKYIEKGDINPNDPHQVDYVNSVISKLNTIRSTADYFDFISQHVRVNRGPRGPMKSAAQQTPEELEAGKLRNTQSNIFRHFVNSANLHVKLTGDSREIINSTIGNIIQKRGPGIDSELGKLAGKAVAEAPDGTTMKNLGLLIAKQILPYLGLNEKVPSNEQIKAREMAAGINEALYESMGITSHLSASNLFARAKDGSLVPNTMTGPKKILAAVETLNQPEATNKSYLTIARK
jgi:hypothetical protein